MIRNLLILSISFLSVVATSQVAPDCSSAIPICQNTPVTGIVSNYGIDDFPGMTTLGDDCIESNSLNGYNTIESHSAWYRFKAGEAGQLGFNIKSDSADDWDFALFKASNCSSLGVPVRCNSRVADVTGYTGVGVNPVSNIKTVQYDDWLMVEPGEEYFLLINNFTDINSGFSIQFTGQILTDYPDTALDCSIFDNLLGTDIFACQGESVELTATLLDAVNYRWYIESPIGFTEIVASAGNDALMVTVGGRYRVVVERNNGQDNVVSEVTVTFTQNPVAYSVNDVYTCDTDFDGVALTDLLLKDVEVLKDQNPSDFLVSYHTSQLDADRGINAIPKKYTNTLNPNQQTIYVRVYSVVNHDCFDTSQNFELYVVTPPQINISQKAFLCKEDASIIIGDTNSILNPNYTYSWYNAIYSPTLRVDAPGFYTLTVTNTVGSTSCKMTYDIEVVESSLPIITDVIIEDISNDNKVTVITEGIGDYEYSLDGKNFQNIPVFTNVLPGAYQLTINDKNGCGTITQNILVIGFLKFFTPNNDTVNDVWQVTGLNTLTYARGYIFDRYGKLLKMFDANNAIWDGTYNGIKMPSTDYWVRIEYVKTVNNQEISGVVTKHFSLKR